MKEEALKLADEWDIYISMGNNLTFFKDTADMIRKLIAELEEVTRQSSDVSSKPLSDEEMK